MTVMETSARGGAKLEKSIRSWALAALVLYVVSGMAFAGFSYLDGGWAAASDATAVLLAIALLVLVLEFDDLFAAARGGVARVAKWIGVVGMTIAIVGGVVLVSVQSGFATIPSGTALALQFIGWGLLGVWFILVAHIAATSGVMSRRWAWAARVAGAGQIVSMAATIPLGPDSVLASMGYGFTFVAVILWAVWTRRELA